MFYSGKKKAILSMMLIVKISTGANEKWIKWSWRLIKGSVLLLRYTQHTSSSRGGVNFIDRRESEEQALGAQLKIKHRRDGSFSKVRTSTHHRAEDEPISAFSLPFKDGLFP